MSLEIMVHQCPLKDLTILMHKADPNYEEIDGGFVAFGRKPALSFVRPFGCPITILNTIDHLGSGPNWLFDIDALTKSMNYKPVVEGNQSNGNGEENIDIEDPWNENEASRKDSEVPSTEKPREDHRVNQELDASINSTNSINTASDGNITNNVNAVSSTVNAAGTKVNTVDPKKSIELPNDPNMLELEDIVYSDDDEDVGAEADMNNLDAFMPVNDYDDKLFDLETVNDDTYDDPFDSKEEKIKDSKILIDELDPLGSSDFLPFPECDSVFYEDFFKVDALPSTNNEDKIFNPGILIIGETIFEVTTVFTWLKNIKKLTNASLILEDFYPPLSIYELPFHKEVPRFFLALMERTSVFWIFRDCPGFLKPLVLEETDIQEKEQKESQKLQARDGKGQVKSKSKVIRMKKIQLEGLKLPSLKLYYKRLKDRAKTDKVSFGESNFGAAAGEAGGKEEILHAHSVSSSSSDDNNNDTNTSSLLPPNLVELPKNDASRSLTAQAKVQKFVTPEAKPLLLISRPVQPPPRRELPPLEYLPMLLN
ncbi:hypothetical protein Tco_1474794 [Tanacetum coccineum]